MAKKTNTGNKASDKTDASAAHEKRLDLLQESIVGVCDRINDDPIRSFTTRAIRARSVDPKVVNAAFDAMVEAIEAGRARYAEAQKGDDVGRVARVDLRSL